MITAGVDMGIENIKIVILNDGKVVASGQAASGGANRAAAADELYIELLNKSGVSASNVDNVVATGQGKWEARFAKDAVVEPVADVKGAHHLHPSARTVVDVGADQARAAVFDSTGKILDTVLNLKCSAGIGMFYGSLARMLDISLDEMSGLSAQPDGVVVNDQCGVFAEIDTHWLIHNGTPKAAIVQARNEAAAARLNSLLNEKITVQKDVVLCGGIARNRGLVNALKKRSGLDFLIPEHPEMVGALGAALIAAE
jgi:benzoyl-CoA reductase subunit D